MTKNGLPFVRLYSAGVDPRLGGEGRHCLGRQRGDVDAERAGAELTEHCAEGMAAGELVVAIRGEDERGHALESAREQSQDVERRFVGPMDVLDDDDGRAASELADQLGGERVRPRPAGCDARQLAADPIGDLEERAKRARCVQRLARGSENAPRAE